MPRLTQLAKIMFGSKLHVLAQHPEFTSGSSVCYMILLTPRNSKMAQGDEKAFQKNQF